MYPKRQENRMHSKIFVMRNTIDFDVESSKVFFATTITTTTKISIITATIPTNLVGVKTYSTE